MSWYVDNDLSPNDSIGIDEVGRGPLAGPVVAVAVWICEDFVLELEKNVVALPVRDSKKMTKNQRQKITSWIKKQPSDCVKYAIASATVEEIDTLNILQAALLSMERAYNALGVSGKTVLVDGNAAPPIKNTSLRTVVQGDSKVLSIALASVIAKEHRDEYMRELSHEYPHYSWEKNVGYGMAVHLQAIRQWGITPHHRKTFAPMKKESMIELY
jgi:ribonuclease HII